MQISYCLEGYELSVRKDTKLSGPLNSGAHFVGRIITQGRNFEHLMHLKRAPKLRDLVRG